jgi:shikimate dehydrogenase
MTNKTKLNLIFGYQVENFSLATMYNNYSRELEIEGNNIFVDRIIAPNNLDLAIKAIKVLDIHSVAVAARHKVEVIDYLDDVDSAAMIIGSVDTVINKDNILTGYNTDWLGILFSLATCFDIKIKNIHHIPRFLEGKKIGLVGLGYSTNAIIYSAVAAGADIMIFEKNKKTATKLIEYFKDLLPLSSIKYVDLKMINSICACEIIINCTLDKNQQEVSPIDTSHLGSDHCIIDFADQDNITKFVKDSIVQKCKIIKKSSVISTQNAFQFELQTGHKAISIEPTIYL